MRLVPPSIVDAFYSGDMSGDRRNFARVTVQHADTKLYALPYNLYASYVFGSDATPKELPNVRSVKWGRSGDQDFATATIEFWNTAPLPLGEKPTRDLDLPGFYTYNRGVTQFSSRWGTEQNQWANMLVPDNILRTYEGYGFDPNSIPEVDPHLVSTGVWRIDDVEYTSDGVITVTCRDIGSILADQIIFPPITPKNFYPVTFTATNQVPGFVGPTTNTVTQDTASVARPASWAGPTDGPATATATAGDRQISVSWTRPSTADTTGTGTTKGYKVVGYQIALDGVLLSRVYKASTSTATLRGHDGIHNGNVYSVRVIAIWKEQLTRQGEIHFRTNIEKETRSNFSSEQVVRPTNAGETTPVVTPGSIAINVDEDDNLVAGAVKFAYTTPGVFTLVAYKKNGTRQHIYHVTTTAPVGGAHFTTGSELGDMTRWNFLVYGRADGTVGPGDIYFAAVDGHWFGAPAPGASPAPAPVKQVPSVTRKTSSTKVRTPLKTSELKLHYNDSSNSYYVGRGEDVQVYGHDPDDAFDHRRKSYWLSIGNDTNGAGYSYEWIEARADHVTLTSVTFATVNENYGVYLSVFSDGKWVQHKDTGVIPYNPDLPESHNHGNIPYAEHHHMSDDDGNGPVTIHLREAIPKVTKIRLTFHNLQYFDVGTYHYRAAVRNFTAKGVTAGSKKKTTGGTTNVPPVVAGRTTGTTDTDVSSVTSYTPAHIVPGLGANPGLYEDYTDIVKLFLAWGGFYWPAGADVVLSDGSKVTYSWGVGEYGLPNVDPVLGDVDGGRIWGDLMDTGTAGIAQIPTSTWTQKTLMDGISYVRDIIQFIFYIDEDGAVVWRRPNFYSIGNWIGNDAAVGTPPRVNDVVVIDEEQTLIGLRAKLSGRNVRERIFVSSTDGTTGALAKGYNPNPTGLRRVGGWTDQHFTSEEECQVMADLIALQQLFSYRTDAVTISGYPAIQIDDQVIIVEQVTGEGFYHYVKGISSTNDLEQGGWEYSLDTYWLGERPFDQWAFNPADLSEETQTYLAAINFGTSMTLPAGSV